MNDKITTYKSYVMFGGSVIDVSQIIHLRKQNSLTLAIRWKNIDGREEFHFPDESSTNVVWDTIRDLMVYNKQTN